LRKTVTALVAALAIGLAGCTTAQDNANTDNYPQEAKDNFVDRCAAEAAGGNDEQQRNTCRCIVDNLQNVQRLPYDRKASGEASFKDADTALKDGNQPPQSVQTDLNEARADCNAQSR
jgi:hypothetical protein